MALQSSGAISLNEIHIEAGGTTGTLASLNDSDIRGLIGKASGAQMSFSEWYGASSSITRTITQGTYSPSQYATYYGYNSNVSMGSADSTNVNINGLTYTFKGAYRVGSSGGNFFYIILSYSSVVSDSAFTSVSFSANGSTVSVDTADAYITSTGGGYEKSWMWNSTYGMTTTEVANMAAELDGSGTVIFTFTE